MRIKVAYGLLEVLVLDLLQRSTLRNHMVVVLWSVLLFFMDRLLFLFLVKILNVFSLR